MNLAVQLTLDGMLRALRWKAHALAEEIEGGYARGVAPAAGEQAAGRAETPGRARGQDDDRAGR
jgi:hypothetical protein